MRLINRTIEKGLNNRYRKLLVGVENPFSSQKKISDNLLKNLRKTIYFKKVSGNEVNNLTQFLSNIPLNDYNSLKPFIEDALKGTKNVLWPGYVKWFAKSSGTTEDKSKFIPVSKATLKECHYKAGRDLLALFVKNNPDTNIFYGNGLIMGGSTQINRMNAFSVTGDLSAILSENLPLWTKLWQMPGKKTMSTTNWEDKINKIAEETIKSNITNITGVPTWTIVLFNKILSLSGKNNIHEVWPNLELYIHGGVSFEPYRHLFAQYLPDSKMKYMETYNASEGFFGIQDLPGQNDLLLLVNHGIFYEFIPFDENFSLQSKTIQLEDVETGKNYAIVISTNSGLWRYVIGDTITFTSVKPYRFVITGRTKHFINAFGEELIIDNADKAISFACKETNSIVKDYTAAPVFFDNHKSGAHEWLIEFEQQPENTEFFIDCIDTKLKELNSDYEAKRSHNLALSKPILHVLPENTFYQWLKANHKLGGQNKVPRLSNNRNTVESILNFLDKNV